VKAVIIGEGLTDPVVGAEARHEGGRRHVGRREVERLLGRGRSRGQGALPRLLRSAAEAKDVGLLFVLERDPEGNEAGLAATLRGLEEKAHTIRAATDRVPGDALLDGVRELVGEAGPAVTDPELRFLIVGCDTDTRVLATATYLRVVLGCPNVAVASHLVGSATQEAHFATLRHTLPAAGVQVLLDLEATAGYLGLEAGSFQDLETRPCEISPPEARAALGEEARRIVELLCAHWTGAELRPLAGGFSGSLLFLASGSKGRARTEPMVLKIDAYPQMRRELEGYYLVKDFFGKHVPTFGYPVTQGKLLGVGMELAAMEGRPETLQDAFEEADSDEALRRFSARFDKALSLLGEKLYGNTSRREVVVPFRQMGLHAGQQQVWLGENARISLAYLEEAGVADQGIDVDEMTTMLRLLGADEGGIVSEVCLAHGDLNFANVICDQGDNIWFIDWTHSGLTPLELDFAKLENDAKFVMSKQFDVEDLPRLRLLEEYLLGTRVPAGPESLPDELKFVKWDLRFRKVLDTVRRIRAACFALKEDEDWLVYRVALLRYATHTLSFDERRGRGECGVSQLAHALYSVEALLTDLVGDDFHLRIRGERPASYPERQRLSIDSAPWLLEAEDYAPAYHVDPVVLAADRTKEDGGWADPEDFASLVAEGAVPEARRHDDEGRPLHPKGRTGLAGRGLLGRWGPNPSVGVVATRPGTDGGVEVLLGSLDDSTRLEAPQGFLRPGEAQEECLKRVLLEDTGLDLPGAPPHVLSEGYAYDPRQTDHAWVERTAFLVRFQDDGDRVPRPGGRFEEVRWLPLDAATLNRVAPGQAAALRAAVQALVDAGTVASEVGEALLRATG
jgi:ADP-ribose pyrophosphatase